MAKQEPWFKPRADEDADEDLVNWLGGWNSPPRKPQTGGGWGCFTALPPAFGAGILTLLAVLR